MATLKQPFLFLNDSFGRVQPNADMYLYEPGSLTPKLAYTDKDLKFPHTFPIKSDARGIFPPIYITGEYRVIIYSQGKKERDFNLVSSDELGTDFSQLVVDTESDIQESVYSYAKNQATDFDKKGGDYFTDLLYNLQPLSIGNSDTVIGSVDNLTREEMFYCEVVSRGVTIEYKVDDQNSGKGVSTVTQVGPFDFSIDLEVNLKQAFVRFFNFETGISGRVAPSYELTSPNSITVYNVSSGSSELLYSSIKGILE